MSGSYGHQEAVELPSDVAILVVDTKGFSGHNDVQQEEMALRIPEVLMQACGRSGLVQVWEGRRFPDSTGDGFIIGFDPKHLPQVVDRYIDAVQEVLEEQAPLFRARGITMRFRLSLNVGPSRELPGVDSPVGKPMIDTHRLGDAEPLRLLLDHSDPEVTFLAAAISERVMEDVVRSGRSRLRESEFAAAPMDIPKKNFKSMAYLRVPKPSGDLLRLGLSGVVAMGQKLTSDGGEPCDGAGDGHRPDQPSPAPSAVHADRGGSAAAIGSVSGSGNTVAGRDVEQSQTTTTVHGSQYASQGDMNFGTRRGRRVTTGGDAGSGSGRESS